MIVKNLKLLLCGPLLIGAFALPLALTGPAAAQTDTAQVKCGNDQVAIGVSINGQNCVDKGTTFETNVIFVWLTSIIKFLTVGVGLAAVGGVVYGGFLYLTARGNVGQVEKGVTTIINALIGVGLYALAFAIINYLVPGGVLR
jgi:hypothetical protein